MTECAEFFLSVICTDHPNRFSTSTKGSRLISTIFNRLFFCFFLFFFFFLFQNVGV